MIEQLVAMPRYEAYKDSGVEWLGEIPVHWNVEPGFTKFTENKRNNRGMKESQVLSLSYGNIVVKPPEKLVGLVPESFETYQLVEPGDIIVRCTDLQNDQTSLRTGLARDKGIITSAYLNLVVKEGNNSKYWYYYLHSLDTTKVIYKFGSGLRQNLSFLDFKRLPIFDIALSEQTAIAVFLDSKTAQIDQAVAIKEKQIALLKQRKQILIQNAVTRGLNPDAPMRDSGVEWIGEIPAHWIVKKLSHVAQIDSGATPDRSRQEFWNGNISWVKTGEVNYNEILETEEHITETGLRSSSTKLSPKGTLLMAMYGQGITRGRVALLGVPATYNQACCAIQFNKLFIEQFTLYFFIAAYPYIRDGGNETSQMNLSTGYISTLKIVCPPWEEQAAIVTHIETESAKIDQAISIQQRQIDKLKEYKATLINSAVTGKIKVPELSGEKNAAC